MGMIRSISRVFIITLLLLALHNSSDVFAFWSSVEPELVDLTEIYGELLPGQSYEGSYYFSIGGTDEELSLLLEQKESIESILWRTGDEVSEERVNNIVFESNPVTIGTTSIEGQSRYSNNPIRYNKELIFTVEIPIDAEPGWHAASIILIPNTISEAGPNARLYSFPRPALRYKVAGEVVRELIVDSVTVQRIADNEVNVLAHVKNQGTVTTKIQPRESFVKIFTSAEEIRLESTLDGIAIAPQETVPIVLSWKSSEPIRDGEYIVRGNVNYRTGDNQFSERIVVPAQLSIPVPGALQIREGESTIESSLQECKTHFTGILFLTLLVIAGCRLKGLGNRKIVIITSIFALILFIVDTAIIC